ncbi:MAG: hypothetical protein KME15_06860 [Drouetiella hepatica Uher 2000/2452]|jgi:hypothetical protein|uniref:Uncharacterized protein n=1 Tax=Drouetiella hepatica Uher 2000/2452 TaxID=904376 RepID=A0A951Q912_9CYAN|nr:hypothetical protein [Drouetiella hepatica Uher 2000/2452]
MTYTPEESAVVLKAVTLSGMAIAMSDLGIISTAIEATALAKEVAGAAKKYPNNSIIQNVFSDESLKKLHLDTPKDITPENAVDQAIVAVHDAVAALTPTATPEELAEYKQFIYAAADHVANAAGSGLFGSGSPKVSEKEMVALAKLKAALAI